MTPPFAKEHPTHPQSQETLFVLLNLLYKQKLRFLFCFSTLPRRGPHQILMEIHFAPLTHHSQPRFSAHISVSGQPIYGLMGGDCIHKALFLWPSLHYIEFPARDLGLAA